MTFSPLRRIYDVFYEFLVTGTLENHLSGEYDFHFIVLYLNCFTKILQTDFRFMFNSAEVWDINDGL